MGSVTITTLGSFPVIRTLRYSAMEGGHAMALSRAIDHLTSMMPKAIQLDHRLHDEGTLPPDADFGKIT